MRFYPNLNFCVNKFAFSNLVLAAFVLLVFSTPLLAQTRQTYVAGKFYPADKSELEKMVNDFVGSSVQTVTASEGAKIVGIISPHAGYPFSGKTAGVAFKSIAGQKFDRIYILGANHVSESDKLAVWGDGEFDTPLGPVPSDSTVAKQLALASIPIKIDPDSHSGEHSIEVLLPFYLKTIGNHPAVFVSMCGPIENGIKFADEICRSLVDFKGRVLIIASSDWSHYHDSATAKKLDENGLDSVMKLDEESLIKKLLSKETEFCGVNGVIALTRIMRKCKGKAVLLQRSDSGVSTGDESSVVGYAAVLMQSDIFLEEKSGSKASADSTGQSNSSLLSATSSSLLATSTSVGISSSVPGIMASLPSNSVLQVSSTTPAVQEIIPSSTAKVVSSQASEVGISSDSMKGKVNMEFKNEALSIVRKTLESVVKGGGIPEISCKNPKFSEKCGVFVTLKKKGELRGCIGFVEGIKPLGEAIPEMTLAASTEDPRFNPVTPEELPQIDIEISVLSPMIPVNSLDEIKVGRDGLMLRLGGRSGLLLPQVPVEWGWDRDTFLEQLCGKAGLPSGSYKNPAAKLVRFTAEIFNEKE
ncbi:MAG: AmmeMemoRadiSam system protein B [Candidatus Riflebacteria bacterium]|nr:AmmeMemoRadiSam system protein B [Candidatus Riflebacteria bacterium]